MATLRMEMPSGGSYELPVETIEHVFDQLRSVGFGVAELDMIFEQGKEERLRDVYRESIVKKAQTAFNSYAERIGLEEGLKVSPRGLEAIDGFPGTTVFYSMSLPMKGEELLRSVGFGFDMVTGKELDSFTELPSSNGSWLEYRVGDYDSLVGQGFRPLTLDEVACLCLQSPANGYFLKKNEPFLFEYYRRGKWSIWPVPRGFDSLDEGSCSIERHRKGAAVRGLKKLS